MKSYELTVVMAGKTTAAKKKDAVERIEKIVAASKGKVTKSDDWGVKDLAYKIKKQDEGLFLYFELELPALNVKNVSEKVKLEDGIIRHLMIAKD